jgi:hypothetical protein
MSEISQPNPLQAAWEDLNAKHETAKAKAVEAKKAVDDLNASVESHVQAIREAFRIQG